MKKLLIALVCLCSAMGISAQEAINDTIVESIRKHGPEESQAMQTAQLMMDVYGPRLTGSPMLETATEWAVKQLKEWGLKKVHTEEWGPFGRGWELQHFEMHTALSLTFGILLRKSVKINCRFEPNSLLLLERQKLN
ncbi:MAG: hypothetical protein KI786_09555 [Mameliella sp.]|nr:hypothetical protein [Phaeodactylibacter sp.]NRA49007.1 hypothetical protein [Phaeodactylibacter sp.]